MRNCYENLSATEKFRAMVENEALVPLAFCYDGQEYRGFCAQKMEKVSRQVCCNGERTDADFHFLLDDTLSVTLRLTHYASHGATEGTVWFENISGHDSGALESIRSELHFAGERPVLRGILGDHVNYYRPYAHDLTNQCIAFSSDSGRATHINFPYFNLEYGRQGVMLAIGWGGTWQAHFEGNQEGVLCTLSAVNGMKTYLKPGEKIRSALFLVAPYTVREESYATNYWRDWYTRHLLPCEDRQGTPLRPFSASCLCNDTGLPNSDGSISERHFTWKPSMEKMLAEGVQTDFRWFDAGWYVRPDGRSEETDWWGSVGTWVLDPVKWPGDSFRQSTDFARAHGMRTLVWFEPERVADPDNLVRNFGYQKEWAIRVSGDPTISNNIGDPACFRWTVDRICKMLRDNRVELYREDNNCNAAALWQHLDGVEGEGRQGITECKLIDAHYRMWDEIIACTSSYGGCSFVDSCASGGGRNDLESMRRGVPLLRSDKDRTTTALRLSITSSFCRWIPFCGANTKEKATELAPTGNSDPYIWRASYLPILNVDSQYVQDPDQDFGMQRFGLEEWKRVNPYLLGDFYPLTPWHSEYDRSAFTALCYMDKEGEKGVLLSFRQEECRQDTLPLRFPFAAEGERYRLTDEDSGEAFETDGKLSLFFSAPRLSRLLWIEKLP